MTILIRRIIGLCSAAIFLVVVFRQFSPELLEPDHRFPLANDKSSARLKQPVKWKDIPIRHPVTSIVPLPTGKPTTIPRIQHRFGVETDHNKQKRLERQQAVKEAFQHSWKGYKEHAWLQDEIAPVSGGFKNGFGQRAATLVDNLDTLIIMGLDDELKEALAALKEIDFTTSMETTLNVFETTIRYLGGLLGAYDLSETKHSILLEKATELGDMLYAAFDTPNRMPITRWNWVNAAAGGAQEALSGSLSAELGSLTLEFTRLSQLTGDDKYFDAVERISGHLLKHQNKTRIAGLFPIRVNPLQEVFNDDRSFTFGGMSDSLYEYLPKQWLLLGGLVPKYRQMYETAIDVAKQHLFFRPMNPENQDLLVAGSLSTSLSGNVKLIPEGQHLACFAGGMVGMGAQIFNRSEDLRVARQLVNGCIWAYDSMPSGIMPEIYRLVPCPTYQCRWDEGVWKSAAQFDAGMGRDQTPDEIIKDDRLPPAFTQLIDPRFLLRPEAIESVFILYRITGDHELLEAAWRMFDAIRTATKTEFAYSSIADVTAPKGLPTKKLDSCESFWMSETLKYFYLIFSEPHVVSLDEYVLNTEAHPLRRPQVENSWF
ncbi:glycoside hydrolase family 47 protein [Aaosphaeria arxii CBS 175.79]|uniref:alpha-1,2-Mannosidase n=1 Tax=Aaosphaeria arxii CBS 175.79 TaxID=1450172 RepID=A0A6A5XTE5_9PLEO|nr:glycoside hydrolase family 47 protein [Aaosphaeria arxii CBS 175.79]KAF2015514.1 glycoside hydrolase family 47 protein [Aaosphaeria arxii CBS 175.79]